MIRNRKRRDLGTKIASPLSNVKEGSMTQMQNIIFGTISGIFAVILAFYQTMLSAEFAIIKDLGMGGAFIVTCFFMFRYFTKQIEDSNKRQTELTEKFMEIAQKAIEREIRGDVINQQVINLLTKFSEDSRHERRSRESRI